MKLHRTILVSIFVLFTLNGNGYADSDLFSRDYDRIFTTDRAADFQSVTPTYHLQPEASSKGGIRMDVGLFHKLLGYGTLLLAAGAAATGSDSPTHHNLAVGAASLGALTLASGYYEYRDMFELDEGLSRYNLHIALGSLGAIGFAANAIAASTGAGHAGLGIASAALMGSAFIIVFW